MKGVILAGGEGTRLRPLTLEVPKPLITIKKRPLINYNLGLLARYGVDDVKILIRPKDQKDYSRWLAEYEREFPGTKIELVAEQVPMGTLGYIFHHLRGWAGKDDIFVTNGDDIKDIDLREMSAFHRNQDVPATLALMRMEKPDDYGAVLVREDRITDFLEKRPGLAEGLVSAGMYIVSPAAIVHVEKGLKNSRKVLMFEKDMFPVLAKSEKLGGFVAEGTFYDCGTFERWEKAIRGI